MDETPSASDTLRLLNTRLETLEERHLRENFEKFNTDSLENLESAARQIIQLITFFFTALFGILSLSTNTKMPYWGKPVILWCSIASLFFLLIALAGALSVVLPRKYQVRNANSQDQSRVYQRIFKWKSTSLQMAIVTFGLGMATFAGLIGTIVYFR